MHILHGGDFREWVHERIAGSNHFGPSYCIGFGNDERLLAAAVYHSFRGHDIQIAFAADSPLWCSRKALRAIFRYPFVDCGVRRLTALVAATNQRSIRLVEGLGFKLEGTVREGLCVNDEYVDMLVYGMLREEWEARYVA